MSHDRNFSANISSPIIRITGLAFIFEQLVFLIAFYILGSSINWPASLDLSAEKAFPLITANQTAVFTGYYFYLGSSILLIVAALLVKSALFEKNNALLNALLSIATGFGVVSGAMKMLGIVRWLFAMPMLAEKYLDPTSSASVKQMAILNYDLLNAYAGKIGEHIGVQLLTALFIATLSLAIMQSNRISSWFGRIGLVVAVISLPFEDMLGTKMDHLLTISGTCIGLWIIAIGIGLIKKAQ